MAKLEPVTFTVTFDNEPDDVSAIKSACAKEGGVKVLRYEGGNPVIGGYGVMFGGKDLYGQMFSPNTDFMLDVVPTKLITYDHALQAEIPDPIGKTIKEEVDDVGIWIEAQLDASSEYAKYVLELVERGVLGLSSGTVGHLVQLAQNVIKRWLIVEYALTPTPAEPRLLGVQRLKSLQGDYPKMKAAIEQALQDNANQTVTMGLKQYITELQLKDKQVNKMSEKEITEKVENEQVADQQPTAPEVDYEKITAGVVKALTPAISEITEAQFKAMFDEKANVPAFLIPKDVVGKHANLGDPDPVEDFYRYLYTGEAKIKKHLNRDAKLPLGRNGAMVKAALQEGADAEGGYLVPADELGRIIEKRDESNILAQMGIAGYTTDRDVFNFPAEGTAMTNFTIVAEEATHTPAQNEPTFAQPAATIYKFMKVVKISEELEEDYNSGLGTSLTNMLGRAWAGTENYYVQVGSGSGQPQGVFVGGTAGLTLDSASAVGAAEIPELIGKLKIQYRNRAVLLANRTTGAYLAGLTGNQFVFRQPPASQAWANGEDLGIGYPVILTEDAAAIGASAKSLLFGNFEFYGWVRNRSLRVLRLGELYRETGQIGIRAWFRAGGVVLQAEAFQYATHPTG